MANYARQQATALRLIKKAGALITITRNLPGKIGANDTPTSAPFTYTCWAVFAPNLGTLGSSFDASLQGLTIVRSKQLIIAALEITPAGTKPNPGDIAHLPIRDYAIGAVTEQAPDGITPIVYSCPVKT